MSLAAVGKTRWRPWVGAGVEEGVRISFRYKESPSFIVTGHILQSDQRFDRIVPHWDSGILDPSIVWN
jgi:hypothetical protein